MNKTPIVDLYRSVSAIIVRRYKLNTTPAELTYLLVKKPRKSHAWQFPQGGQDKGETGAEAALRELREECGSDLGVSLVDTAPVGEYQYKFPRPRTDGYIGAKVSFFRADYLFGECQPDGEEIIDYKWVTKQQMNDYVHQEYKDALKSIPF